MNYSKSFLQPQHVLLTKRSPGSSPASYKLFVSLERLVDLQFLQSLGTVGMKNISQGPARQASLSDRLPNPFWTSWHYFLHITRYSLGIEHYLPSEAVWILSHDFRHLWQLTLVTFELTNFTTVRLYRCWFYSPKKAVDITIKLSWSIGDEAWCRHLNCLSNYLWIAIKLVSDIHVLEVEWLWWWCSPDLLW